jgi:hypothetical protein
MHQYFITIDDNSNVNQAFQSFRSKVEGDIYNLTNAVIDSFETYFEKIGTDVASLDVHLGDLDFPTLNDTSFDLAIPNIPEYQLLFKFDDLKLYMEIHTTLSEGAIYTFNLYKAETPLRISAGQDLEAGFEFLPVTIQSAGVVFTALLDLACKPVSTLVLLP